MLPVAATFNLASVFVVLHAGRIHPVRYHLQLSPVQELLVRESFLALCLSSVLAAALIFITLRLAAIHYWRRAGLPAALDGRGALWRACWPAAAATAWVPLLLNSSRLNLLILFACICLFAWSASRFVNVVLGSVLPRTTARPKPTGCNPCVWWREAWFGVLVVLVVALTIFHTHVQIGMYHALRYGGPDIAYYAEMLHNAARGRGLRCEAYGHDFFGEHFSPGLYLLVPLWAIFGRIELLMVLGAVSVLSGSLGVYALARTYAASPRVAAVLGIAYLLYPSTSRIIYGGTYGFHEILLVVPLMFWVFYHCRRRQWWRMGVLMVLALSLKENVAIVCGAFGLYVYVCDRRDRWGLALCMACMAYFAACLMWIVPAFSSSATYSKFYLYDHIGGTPGGVLATLFREPGVVLGRLASWQALCYVLSLSVPVGLVLFTRPVALVALPTLTFTVLMNTPDFSSIRFWHQASIIPVLWLATVEAVTRNRTNAGRSVSWSAAVLVSAMLMHYGLGFSPVSQLWHSLPDAIKSADRSELIEDLQRMIPLESTVQATARLGAHFYDRDRVYPLHVAPPNPPEWILIDIDESFTGPESRETTLEFLNNTMASGLYDAVFQDASVHLFRLRPGAHSQESPRRQ